MCVILAAALTMALGGGAATASADTPTSTTPPFHQCPAVGSAPGCAILLIVNADRTVSVAGDNGVGPYDGADDSLIGIVNLSSTAVDAVTVTGTGSDLSGFDGDGLCTYVGCSYPAPTGYEGPDNTFTTDPAIPDSAEVDFTTPLAPGSSSYFSLEGALTAASLTARPGHLAKDTDGDGIPDSWEDSPGRDLGGGVFDGALHSLGASSLHKDIFLHIDSEKGAELSDKATQLLIDAFAKAPVQNQDQQPGIRLHVIKGTTTLSESESDALRASKNDPDWLKIFERYKADPELNAFHYVVSAHWDRADYAGQTDRIPGQFIVVNNCGTRRVPRFLFFGGGLRHTCAASDADQAANLMHELGHNLGLHHGGAGPMATDDLEDQFKPNYLSVMSYNFSHSGVPGIGLTYSQWGPASLPVLDENSLSEPAGIQKLDNSIPAAARTFYYCPADGKMRTVKLGAGIDWNCKSGREPSPVSANIDFPRYVRQKDGFAFLNTKRTLSPHEDWSTLLYGGDLIGQSSTTYPGPIALADQRALAEPTREERTRLAAEVNPIPTLTAKVTARDRSSVTLTVPVSTTTDGVLTWSPVEPDGSPGQPVPGSTVRAGNGQTFEVRIPLNALTGRQGVVVNFTNDDWTVSGVTPTRL
ncbi:hypothetical protein [Amycolatopsis nalaikhensis]|uniref:Uncharacterized protein n=1 Tax=Amycolatopsis nalaikhensis TaxID=715472 RepID=A0ABY8XQ62_9PSEU|nr:hypothetical protein [Amycolatopsis sp. 2-2]WIV57784.1 hypothetical protein QP939_03615 [Amycolatopsis sp. 2-2]